MFTPPAASMMLLARLVRPGTLSPPFQATTLTLRPSGARCSTARRVSMCATKASARAGSPTAAPTWRVTRRMSSKLMASSISTIGTPAWAATRRIVGVV